MPGLPDKCQQKVMLLLDAEQQALTAVTMTQRQIGESQKALDLNSSGDKADALAREIARLQSKQPDNQARHRLLADLNARVSRYLEMLPAHVQLDDAKRIKPKLADGETHLKVVQRIRAELVGLIGERSRVERSSPTVAEMKAAATRFVEQLARDGTPRLIIEHGKNFDLQFGRGVIGEDDPSPAQVLAWIDPEAVVRRLHEQIDEAPKSTNSMTFADRKKRLAEISDELFNLERLEQTHIDAAAAEGSAEILNRPNVDVRALLGLVVLRDKATA